MMAPNPTYLFNNNTHNPHHVKTICWSARPCYRKTSCKCCWNRYSKFIKDQAELGYRKFDFSQHVIISFESTTTSLDAFQLLSEVRASITRKLGKRAKYLMAPALGEHDGFVCAEYAELLFTPHLHLVVSKSLDKKIIKLFVKEKFPSLKVRVKVVALVSAPACRRLVGYILNQNIKKALAHAPKKLRLLTSSKGFYTGRPRMLNKLEYAWAA